MPHRGAEVRYLRAKASVDARAVNPAVRQAVTDALAQMPADRPIRMLECGGGAGDAFRQWIELLAPFPRVEFTVVDRDADLLSHYRHEVHAWAGEMGFRMVEEDANRLRFGGGGRAFDVRFREAAVPRGFDAREDGAFDLLIAQSFWDLVGRGTALSLGRRLLAPGGIFYATLTFAGVTRFGPPHELDRRLLVCYHASMAGDRGGDPIAGERLLGEVRLPGSGFREVAVGRSDWRVDPTDEGYPSEEDFFLETILGFVEQEVREAPEIAAPELNEWLFTRRRQLANLELSFAARQQDMAARRDPADQLPAD